MGLKECIITLENPWNTYYPGQTVNGKADFTFDKPKKIRGICIKFKGVAEVKWSSTATTTDSQGKSRDITVDNTANEEYFSITYYLLGSKTGNEIELPAGSHSYPFTCALPPTLPSSFEGEHGFVRYTVKVTLDRPWKFDQETMMAFTVTSHLDLNMSPQYRQPIHIQMEKTFCCCWCKSGPVAVDIRLPVSGYCCGQTMPFDINCENNSGVVLDGITLKLIKYVTYRCQFPERNTKERQVVIAEIKVDRIEGNEARHVQRTLEIPPLPPSNLTNCGIIDLVYKIKVDCNVSGFHMDMDDIRDVTLGTVPLVGFQPPPSDGQTNNMLPDVPPGPQNAETPLMVEQQNAAPHFSQPSPGYPIQNVPYPPQGNAPYPPQGNAPYPPQGNAPYPPQSGMPYPPQNAQYPPQSPYPPQGPTGAYPPMNENNMAPSAPMMGDQPSFNIPNSSYPGMMYPVFKESQFSTTNIHDSTDNEHTRVSGQPVFAPRYPTYGFIPQ